MMTKSPFFQRLNTMFFHITSLTCCMSLSAISDPSPYMVWKPHLVPPRMLRKNSLRKNIRIERRRYFIPPKRLNTRYSSSHAIFQWNTWRVSKYYTQHMSQHCKSRCMKKMAQWLLAGCHCPLAFCLAKPEPNRMRHLSINILWVWLS